MTELDSFRQRQCPIIVSERLALLCLVFKLNVLYNLHFVYSSILVASNRRYDSQLYFCSLVTREPRYANLLTEHEYHNFVPEHHKAMLYSVINCTMTNNYILFRTVSCYFIDVYPLQTVFPVMLNNTSEPL